MVTAEDLRHVAGAKRRINHETYKMLYDGVICAKLERAANVGLVSCRMPVPAFMMGRPSFKAHHAARYIRRKLKKNGFDVDHVDGSAEMIVSWAPPRATTTTKEKRRRRRRRRRSRWSSAAGGGGGNGGNGGDGGGGGATRDVTLVAPPPPMFARIQDRVPVGLDGRHERPRASELLAGPASSRPEKPVHRPGVGGERRRHHPRDDDDTGGGAADSLIRDIVMLQSG